MSDRRVTVFGGSGFLGRRIALGLAADGALVRIAVRRPERAQALTRGGRPGQITAVRADVWDEATVAPALAGAAAVVNTVGHYVERGAASFEAIHGQGARHVAAAAGAAGVARLVHISGIGADPASDSPYVRARATGERLVRAAFPGATIVRPSVMFGPDHDFLVRLAGLARMLPALPLFGAGNVRLQPVYVDDVAAAVIKALATPAAAGQLYELGGPRVYSYKELIQLVLEQTGRRRVLLPMPYFAWNALAALMAPLPNRPISRDQVKLMQTDNVVSPGALTFADLGLTPAALEAVAPTYLRRDGG
ncbi:MAG TPA: complex I NDUFA9 subunit family protein [Geminicoccaceae bacterium]|nr:complex I NDUFA9 subunit family protein [Geminicoccaceae bacterium]